jgi:Ca2+-binding RTX toxin-like protein
MLTITYGFSTSTPLMLSLSEQLSAAAQTAAIQGALDAVAGHTGGFVTLSSGTFTVSGTGKAADGALRVGSDTVFSGAGIGDTVIKLAAGSASCTGIVRTDSGGTNPDGTVKTTSNVRIENFTIDGNKAATTGEVDGFYCGPKPNGAAFDSNITVNRVEIHDVSRYGFDPHEQTKGLTFSNSIAHNNGVDGFTIDFASDVSLVNNQSYDNGRHGFNVVTSSYDVRFLDNDSWGNGQSGIVVQTGDNEIRNFTNHVSIAGGHIYDNGRAGIEVRQASDVTVSHVFINDNKLEGIVLSGVDGASLSGNAMSGNGKGLAVSATPVRIEGMLQNFGDTDTNNDRYVVSKNITINGIKQTDPNTPIGVTLFNYSVTAGADTITGSKGRDVIAANGGNDVVRGQSGNDVLHGEGGSDKLYGGSGTDTLYGDDGNDWLSGDTGWDTLTGGRGSDVFVMTAHWGTDTVTDFRNGSDKISLKGIAGLTSLTQVSVSQTGSDTKIGFGSDYIVLKDVSAAVIDASDFILA